MTHRAANVTVFSVDGIQTLIDVGSKYPGMHDGWAVAFSASCLSCDPTISALDTKIPQIGHLPTSEWTSDLVHTKDVTFLTVKITATKCFVNYVSGFNSCCPTFISVCNQPPRSTQPGHPSTGNADVSRWVWHERRQTNTSAMPSSSFSLLFLTLSKKICPMGFKQ